MNGSIILKSIASAGLLFMFLPGCVSEKKGTVPMILMKETQLTHSAKNHALDNNDNFSPDAKYLCYDTRGTVFNTDLANCKTIEKVEIASGAETVLWAPPSVSGEKAAPGVAAVSWHPSENKVVFINGPFLEEVAVRGYYGKPNRTALEVSADGKQKWNRVEMRDVSTDRPTTPGAHRGGTHRHEYSRNGKRIGFTYDDFLSPAYDRTIGYMELHPLAPQGYTHYFSLLVRPVEKDQSKAGEIEKAWDDSWVDAEGNARAFIARIRSHDGIGYDSSLCVADIPANVDITSAFAGDATTYPRPAQGIKIRRLTHAGWAGGIVRGSADGREILYLSKDDRGIKQAFVIAADGSDQAADPLKRPRPLTRFEHDASDLRWHSSGDWIFCLSNGNIIVTKVGKDSNPGKMIWLTRDRNVREQLVVSPDGNRLAYVIATPTKDGNGQIVKDVEGKNFRQIYILDLDWDKIVEAEQAL
jgi:hypothetical protein